MKIEKSVIIQRGDSDCVHYEIINTSSYGEPLIGRCVKCGRTKDYTVLHKKRRIYGANWLMSRPEDRPKKGG